MIVPIISPNLGYSWKFSTSTVNVPVTRETSAVSEPCCSTMNIDEKRKTSTPIQSQRISSLKISETVVERMYTYNYYKMFLQKNIGSSRTSYKTDFLICLWIFLVFSKHMLYSSCLFLYFSWNKSTNQLLVVVLFLRSKTKTWQK